MKKQNILWILATIGLFAFLVFNTIQNRAEARQYNVNSYHKVVNVEGYECIQFYRYYNGQEYLVDVPVCNLKSK